MGRHCPPASRSHYLYQAAGLATSLLFTAKQKDPVQTISNKKHFSDSDNEILLYPERFVESLVFGPHDLQTTLVAGGPCRV